MPNSRIYIDLTSIPKRSFQVQVREYKPKKKNDKRRCPVGQTPLWVKNLCKNGQRLSLPPLIDHAGSHFLDSRKSKALRGGTTRQRKAARTWSLISMLEPSVKNGKLWVKKIKDSDIKRLCSEIFAVGAGLHLLTAVKVIDFRTIEKIGKDFDYVALSPKGKRLLIESKGTSNGVALDKHRRSFANKLKNTGFLVPGANRGYSNEIGIIFSTWSTSKRKHDVELLDPERRGETFQEERIRAVIRHYARRFAEDLRNTTGAQRLYDVANSPNLFSGGEPLLKKLGSDKHESHVFYRVVIRFRRGGRIQAFLGGFWEGRAIETPYHLGKREKLPFRIAFVGFDREVLRCIRQGRFDDLLEFRSAEQQFLFRSSGISGQFSLDEYGVLRGWMTEVPPAEMIFVVPDNRH